MLSVIATLGVTSLLWAAIAVQVSGAWTLTFDPDFGGTRGTNAECTLAQKDEALTGTCGRLRAPDRRDQGDSRSLPDEDWELKNDTPSHSRVCSISRRRR